MPPFCPLAHAGGYRGPPPPLILAPIIYQLVRRSCDPKMVAYVKDLVAREGPQAIAANAHKLVQYSLSKVPANVLYWFASKVLNLPPETAMQTTAFLKSRTEIEEGVGPAGLVVEGQTTTTTPPPPLQISFEEKPGLMGLASTSDIERRLERLEMDYQVLQEKHYESMRALAYQPENMYLPVCFSPVSCHAVKNKKVKQTLILTLSETSANFPCRILKSCKPRQQRGPKSKKSLRSWSQWIPRCPCPPNRVATK